MRNKTNVSVTLLVAFAGVIAGAGTIRPALAQSPPAKSGMALATRGTNGQPQVSSTSRTALTAIAFSPDGTRVAAAASDKTAQVWDAARNQLLLTLSGHHARVTAVAYSRDGKRLATGSWDTTARVWDASSGQVLMTLYGHTGAVVGLALSPDGTRLATASSDQTAKLWDVASGKVLMTLSGHSDAVYGIAFSPDGMRLATASWDKTAKVWDASTGRELMTLSGHRDRLYAVTFSPDGGRLATAGWDRTVRLWDLQSSQNLFTFNGQSAGIWCLTFSPDGKTLTAGTADGTAKVWDAISGKLALTLSGHSGAIYGIGFSPDGKRLGTASDDGTARVWDPASGRELFRLSGSTGVATANGAGQTPAASATLREAKNQGPDSGKSSPSSGNPAGYKIGAGDVLQVSVWKEPEASAPEVVVRSDGKISLPIIREVEAVGLTPAELEKALTAKLSKFINQPEVSVVARAINSEKVYLVGGVRKEGPVRLLSPMTVMQVLSEAGGLTDYAKKKNIYILRTENQKQVRIPFNYEAVIKGDSMDQNIVVLPGDMIVIPQ